MEKSNDVKCTNKHGVVVAFKGNKLNGITKIKAVNGDRSPREYDKALKSLLSRKWGARRAARFIKENKQSWQANGFTPTPQ